MTATREAENQHEQGTPANRDETNRSGRSENTAPQVADEPAMPCQGLSIGEM